MPRARKPQQAAAPTGQDYGDHQAQIQAQQALPLPNEHAPGPAVAPSSPPAAAGPGAGTPGPPQPAADPLAAAMGMAPPDPPPWAGDGAPDEMVTAGLPVGPGPGPEALRAVKPRVTQLAEMLQKVSAVTGNPLYAELAQEADQQ